MLIPRKHLSSDVFALEDGDYESLIRATEVVVDLIKQTFNKYNNEISDDGCECYDVGIIFEGYEIDYTHVRLYPVLFKKITTTELAVAAETTLGQEKQKTLTTPATTHKITGNFIETYQGHITSKYGPHRRFDSNNGD